MTDPGKGDYERGHLAGEVAARLAGHDQHFAAINGHLADLSRMVAAQQLDVSRLLAESPPRPWLTPLQRIFAEMAGLAAFAAFAAWVLSIITRVT